MSAGYPAISHITTHQSNPDSLDVSAGHQVPKTTVLTQEFVLPVSLPNSTASMLSTEESVHLVPASINLPLHAILQLSSDPALASLLKDQGTGKTAGVTLQLPPDALKVFASQGLLPSANNEKRPSLEDLAAVLAAQTKDGRLMVSQADVNHPSPNSSAAALTSRILQTLTVDSAGGGDTLLTTDLTYTSQSGDNDKNRQLHDTFSDTLTSLQMEALLNATNVGTPSSSTFDLFDGESSMTDFNVDGDSHDLHLSPQAFLNDPGGDHDSSSGGNDSHQSNTSQPGGAASGVEGQMQVASGSSEKVPRGKGRPAKTGPGRHGATCGICGKAFNNSSALAKHKLTHSDERKYVCPICSKAFKRQDHLNGHMMTHRSKKPFECQFEGCDKSYCDARSLRRHLENQHVHNPELGAIGQVDSEAKYYTGSNDQYFQFDPQYRQQIIANGEGRPFEPQKSPGYLAQCSPVTPTSPMHRFPYNPFDEPKPIQCSVCQRRFKNIPALNGHMRLHGGYFRKDNEDEDDEDSKKSTEESSSKLSLNNSLKSENSQSSNSATASSNNNNNHQPGAGFSALKEMFKQQRQQRDDAVSTNPSAQSMQQGRGGLMGGGTVNPSMSTPSQQQPLQSPHTVNTSQSHFTFSTSVPINIIQSSTAVSNSTFSHEQQIAAALIQHQQQHNLPSISVAGPDMTITSNTEAMVSLPLTSDYSSAQQNYINVTDSSSYENLTGYQDDGQISHINSPMSHHSQSVPNTPSHLTANHVMTPNHHMSQPCTPNHPLTPTHPPHTPTQPNHLPHTPSYSQAHPPHTPTLPTYHTSVHMSGNHPMTPGPTTPSHVMTPGPHTHSHPNTPHPHTPSHPMTPQPHTPNHPLTPGPHTPSHPHTPQPHTPSHPLTPNRNKQQGTFFNFPVPAPPQQQQQLQQLRPQPQLQPPLPQFQPTRPQFLPNTNNNNGQQQLRLQLQLQQQQQQQQQQHQQIKAQLQHLQQQQEQQLQLQQQLEQQQQQQQLQELQQQQLQQQQLQQIQFHQQIQLHQQQQQQQQQHQQQDQFVRMTPSVGSTTSEALESALDQLAAENLPSLEQLTSSDLNQIDNFSNFPGEMDSSFPHVKQEDKEHKLEDFFPLQDTVNERKRRASADPDKFTQPKRSAIFYVGSGADSVRQSTEGGLESSGMMQRYHGGPVGNQMQHEDVKVLQTLKSELAAVKSDKDLFQRPRSRADELSLRRVRTDDGGILSRSHPGRELFNKSKSIDGGGSLFRNPSAVGASRVKKKHRPEPLIIPPHVSHFGFQSRLRSPRLWEGNESGMTPPPYTPPPMLSPVRSGSGLFWLITPTYRPVTPKSAPITPRLLQRRNSGASAGGPPLPLPTVPSITEEGEDEEEEEEPPPETDILPHVNVGPQYQAEITAFVGDRSLLKNVPPKEELVWHPDDMDDLTEEEVQYYQDFACCAAVPGNGTNKEYALHLLHLARGNIKEAMLLLMKSQPKLPRGHTLLTYKYQECDSWSLEEIEAYHQALMKWDKDFFAISKQVNSKSVKQCIQFYYLWKKVCSDEYKRLRIIRRKREQDELYSLRSKAAQEDKEGTPSPKPDDDGNFNCEFPGCNAAFSTRQGLGVHVRSHTRGHSPHRGRNTPSPGPPSNKSTISEDGEEIFPCKICGKIFHKVKSRNAHMKSHRPVDPERTYYSHVDGNG